eukprot:3198679-Pyramimonas_sp.AAC.1
MAEIFARSVVFVSTFANRFCRPCRDKRPSVARAKSSHDACLALAKLAASFELPVVEGPHHFSAGAAP